MTYEEYKIAKRKETLDFHGVSNWHSMGFKGKGINFLELEDSEHGENVVDIFSLVAPEAKTFLHGYNLQSKGNECLYFNVIVDGKPIDLKEFVIENNIHIIGLSVSSESEGMPRPAEEYLKSLGVVLVGAAGNNDLQGVTGKFERVGINIGAIKLIKGNVMVESYSAMGEDSLHFTTLHGELNGTSFAQPVFSGMVALIMQRYGLKTQEEVIEIMKSISVDYGVEGYDTSFGWGVPRLPEKINDLESTKLTGRLGHLEKVYVTSGKVKRGQKIARMGNTGQSNGSHLDLAFIYGEHDFFTYLQIEKGEFIPCEKILYDFISNDLFKIEPFITTTYKEEGYKITYANGLYEHYGVDVVPINRKQTTDNFDIYAPFDLEIKKVGYNSSLGNYMIIGVDMMIFKDIENHWAKASIEKAIKKGIVNGYEDGTFRPDKTPTRAELMVILDRLGLLD
jgi:hypothetical protein